MTGSNKLFKVNILFFSVIVLFFQCNKTQEGKDSVGKSQIQNVPNFDAVLKCSDYAYDENYFLTADYGCIYNPKEGNTFGNLIIYLFPKNKLTISDDQIDSEVEKVNLLSIEQVKKDFDIYIYLIPKDDLNYNPQGDPVYYQNEKYKEQLFTLKNNKWQLTDSITINNASEHQKEQEWRESFLQKTDNQP
ncbi:hypothetical protein VUJ46_01620 [Chryseobacterium sp. MYb264]|uniref:hypothetical protein n=1 Tax=Chryseobacterium sp. MYb264 TaxID=2745153 RepID=UPI002E163E63|nr:hypothetical protein VUJ46_01620 [Chryseobacterium sp. MYb264]